jgi:hypothetical protein
MSLDATTFIYGLRDPRDSAIRYVGKADDLKTRFKKHLIEKGSFHRCRWIAQLKSLGLAPELFVIERVSKDRWQEAERFWIRHYRALGYDLTNTTVGGDGVIGLPLESRRRQAEKLKAHPEFKEHMRRINKLSVAKTKGRPMLPHVKEMLIKINKERVHSAEERRGRSEAMKGRKLSPEAIAKRTAKLLGIKRSPETIEKMRLARLGFKHKPEAIEKIRAKKLGKKLSAEHRATLAEVMQRVRQTEEYKRQLSEGQRKRWANPELAERFRQSRRTEEFRKRASETARRAWELRRAEGRTSVPKLLGRKFSAEHRAKLAEVMQKLRQTEEYKRRLSEGVKRSWVVRKAEG